MITDQAIQRIRAFCADQKLSRNRLAIMAGLVESSIRHMDRPNWNPTADTLRALEAVIPADWQPRAATSARSSRKAS
jgi:hypothetical protein